MGERVASPQDVSKTLEGATLNYEHARFDPETPPPPIRPADEFLFLLGPDGGVVVPKFKAP
jgi:hypothetical protein